MCVNQKRPDAQVACLEKSALIWEWRCKELKRRLAKAEDAARPIREAASAAALTTTLALLGTVEVGLEVTMQDSFQCPHKYLVTCQHD